MCGSVKAIRTTEAIKVRYKKPNPPEADKFRNTKQITKPNNQILKK
ncbi:hypothetical protein D3OALGA1CA_2309 [Olavius algarvensis associated proteobacterium Delta 3]|nr:hypothetical protein D3OALGB2SA_211 [Olavius algarvensis associated proteobacterium Delta 3]CAB5116700.1 hypothetical protein D3OALGA1CA_2309 [Olavius algarvensis associated proteobacterium Delta 3]